MQRIKYSAKTSTVDKSTTKFHLINCEIEANGEANVSKFFEPAIVKKDDSRADVSFRGRPMNGKRVQLPDDFVLASLKTSLSDDSQYTTADAASELHYWNFDQQPDLEDSTNQAINWIHISKCLGDAVTMDELNAFE